MPLAPRARRAALSFLTCMLFVSIFCAACNTPASEISLATRTSGFTGNIYIGGAVNNPGYYPLMGDDSLDSLIKAAGGMKDGADLTQVTLTIAEPVSGSLPQRININRAEAWLLSALPGIGETHARDIIDYRTANGPFRSVNDLLNVKGIGQATLDKIKDLITVSG